MMHRGITEPQIWLGERIYSFEKRGPPEHPKERLRKHTQLDVLVNNAEYIALAF